MEESGLGRFPRVVGTEVVQLDVQKLLNGVDLEGTRKTARMTDALSTAVRLFYSYPSVPIMMRQLFARNLLSNPEGDGGYKRCINHS